jgi:hypothetical protein
MLVLGCTLDQRTSDPHPYSTNNFVPLSWVLPLPWCDSSIYRPKIGVKVVIGMDVLAPPAELTLLV